MADLKTHELHTLRTLGDTFTSIHCLIDSRMSKYGARHRHIYHHWEGIEHIANTISQLNGIDYDIAYEAAKAHVRLDFTFDTREYPIPYKKDYAGGEGDWPACPPWSEKSPPWDVKQFDNEMKIDKSIIDLSRENCSDG